MADVAIQGRSRRSLRSERGATAVEYAMMIALIAFVMMATVSLLGERLSDTFGFLGNVITNSPASSNDEGGGAGGGGGDGSGSGDNNGWGDGVGGGQGHNG